MFKIILTGLILVMLSFSLFAVELKFATVEFPPYSFTEDGEVKGIQVDILKRILDDENIKYSFNVYPFPRALALVTSKDRDFIFNFYKNPDRLKIFDYSDAFVDNPLVIFSKNEINFTGKIEDLAGLTIGTMRGYTYSPEFDKAVAERKITVDETESHETNFRKLAAGRIDIYIVERRVGEYILLKLGLRDNFVINRTPLITQTGFVGIEKTNPNKQYLEVINKGLKRLRDSGEINKIYDKYLK